MIFPLPGAWEDTPSPLRPSSAPPQELERDNAERKMKRRVTVGHTEKMAERSWSPSAIMYTCNFFLFMAISSNCFCFSPKAKKELSLTQ